MGVTISLKICTRVLLVNGEHHIGFYTSKVPGSWRRIGLLTELFKAKAVARGEELFLNYGEKYWGLGDKHHESDGSEESND